MQVRQSRQPGCQGTGPHYSNLAAFFFLNNGLSFFFFSPQARKKKSPTCAALSLQAFLLVVPSKQTSCTKTTKFAFVTSNEGSRPNHNWRRLQTRVCACITACAQIGLLDYARVKKEKKKKKTTRQDLLFFQRAKEREQSEPARITATTRCDICIWCEIFFFLPVLPICSLSLSLSLTFTVCP